MGSCLLYRRGEDVIGLVQQDPSRPLGWPSQGVEESQLGGTRCLRLEAEGVDLVQIEPRGRNVTLVAKPGTVEAEALVRTLVSE